MHYSLTDKSFLTTSTNIISRIYQSNKFSPQGKTKKKRKVKKLPIGVKQSSGTKIRLRVPPVTRAGCATASTQYTLVHPIKLRPIFLTLQNLFPFRLRRVLPLQPRLDTLVLVVEVRHIHHQVLDHEHVRQRRDRRGRRSGLDLREARQPVAAVDVHGAGPADPLAARSPERERGVHLVLDLDQGVEDHGPAVLEVDLVVLELRLRRVFRGPAVDREGFERRGGAFLLFGLACVSSGACVSR